MEKQIVVEFYDELQDNKRIKFRYMWQHRLILKAWDWVKEADLKSDYALQDCIYTHFGKRKNQSMLIGVRVVVQLSSVAQSCPTLWPHGRQHARPPRPSPTPGAYSNSCPLSRWCHPTISSSVVPFSSHVQSFNKEFMIWATVSSQSCFCWLYRAYPSLAAKNIISLISVLTIWWCPCVESSLVLLDEGFCYDQCVLLIKLY